MPNQVFVDFILRGLEGFADAEKRIRAFAQSAKGLDQIGGSGEKAARGLRSVADEAEKGQRAIAQQAQAQARLAVAQGDSARAVGVLKNALTQLTQNSVAALRIETQLVGVQSQLANAAGKADTALLREAQSLARIQQQLGNTGGAVSILENALKKASNPNSLAALRAQLQKTYLDTGYKNSPLVGMLQQINSQFDRFSPLLNTISPRLTRVIGFARTAASAFQNTGPAVEKNAASASGFLDKIKKANEAIVNFGKDQGGTASFTDALLNLSKIASSVGDRIRATFARIKEAVANAFANLKQGKNPLAGLFSSASGPGTAGGSGEIAKIATSLGGVEEAAGGAAEAVGGIGAASSSAALAVGGVVAAVLALAAGIAVVAGIAEGLKKIGEDGITANRELEKLRISLGTVISGVGEIKKNGITLTGAEKFNAALTLANDQTAKLKEEATALGLPIQEAAEGFQTTIGPLTQFGLGLDDARKTTLSILVAMNALGIPLREAGQEARAILQGQTDRTARLNQILRITKDELAAAKERGQVQQLLNERLAGFAAGGATFAKSFDGSIARAQARIRAFEQGVTEGLFNTIRDRINSALDGIAQNGSIAATFSGLGDTLTNIFNRAGEAVGPLFDLIISGVRAVSGFLSANQETVDKIIESVAIIIEQIAGIITDIGKTIGLSADWGAVTDNVAKILKVVAVALAGIRETIFLVRSAFFSVGAAIGFAVLAPLGLALQATAALASIIPGLGTVAKGVSDVVNNTAKSLAAAAKNNGAAVVDTVKNFGKAGVDAVKRIDEASAKFAARRKADAAKGNVDTSGLSFTGKPPKEDDKEKKARQANIEGSLKQVREAELALRKAFADRDIALARAEADLQNRILDQQLEDRQIGLESFYHEKAILVEEDRQREVAAIQSTISAERAKLEEINAAEQRQLATEAGKKAKDKKAGEPEKISNEAQAERLKTLAKIVDLETKLSEAELKGDANAAQNIRNRIKALRDLQSQVAGVSVELARAAGDDLNAALAEIDAKFADTLKTFIANFGDQAEEVRKLLKLIGLQKQGAQAEFAIRLDVPNASRDFAESEVQRQVTAGLLSEAEARQRLLDIQRAYASETLPLIRKQIEELEKLAKAEIAASPVGQASPQTRAKILEKQKQEQDILRGTLDPFFAEVKRGFTQDLKGAFEQFLLFSKGGVEDLKDLALNFIESFKRAISKVLSEQIEKKFIDPLVNKLFNFLGIGGASVDPAQLANTVATNANTAALTSLTAAVTTSSVTGAVNGDVAGIGENAASDVTGPDGALGGFFEKIKGAFEKFANGLKSIATGIGSGIKSVLAAIVGGISSLVGSLFGGGGKVPMSVAPAFAEGGFTGAGDKFQPAGVVHAGEFVQPANVVNRWGVGMMEAIRRGDITPSHFNFNDRLLSGIAPRRSFSLADGGMALAGPSTGNAPVSVASPVRNIVVFDDKEVTGAMASAEGERVTISHIKRKRGEILQILGIKA